MLKHADLTFELLCSIIDHTFLKPFGKKDDIERLCDEAKKYHFAMVAVNPAEIENCIRFLEGSGVHTGAAIGFPLGQNSSEVKSFEIKDAINRGSTEIDMVINIRELQSGNSDKVRKEIATMVNHCRKANVISKVILETCYLTDEQKRLVCMIALEEGADFVKTSTGFGLSGATIEDIKLMRSVVGPEMGVKASGGIRTLDAALTMIEAGANRIGTSCGVTIAEEYKGIRQIDHSR